MGAHNAVPWPQRCAVPAYLRLVAGACVAADAEYLVWRRRLGSRRCLKRKLSTTRLRLSPPANGQAQRCWQRWQRWHHSQPLPLLKTRDLPSRLRKLIYGKFVRLSRPPPITRPQHALVRRLASYWPLVSLTDAMSNAAAATFAGVSLATALVLHLRRSGRTPLPEPMPAARPTHSRQGSSDSTAIKEQMELCVGRVVLLRYVADAFGCGRGTRGP